MADVNAVYDTNISLSDTLGLNMGADINLWNIASNLTLQTVGVNAVNHILHATHSPSVTRDDISPLLHKYYDLFLDGKALWGSDWRRAVDAFMRFETMCSTPVSLSNCLHYTAQ